MQHRMWFLVPGGLPFPASRKTAPPGAAWWCEEGDAEWRPVLSTTAQKASARPALAAMGQPALITTALPSNAP